MIKKEKLTKSGYSANFGLRYPNEQEKNSTQVI